AAGADVDELQPVAQRRPPAGQLVGGQPRQAGRPLGVGDEQRLDVDDRADDVVEPDAAEADPRLAHGGAAAAGDDDRRPGGDDAARLLGVAAVEADVDRPGQVPGGELGGRPDVEHDRAVGDRAVDR